MTTAVDEEHIVDFDVPVEEDRRLPMFGYTVETINMLVLPMVKTKYSNILFSNHFMFYSFCFTRSNYRNMFQRNFGCVTNAPPSFLRLGDKVSQSFNECLPLMFLFELFFVSFASAFTFNSDWGHLQIPAVCEHLHSHFRMEGIRKCFPSLT